MNRLAVRFQDVAFQYASAAEKLLSGLTAHFPMGWIEIVGANGSGKTTVLKLATGQLIPRCGSVQIPGESVYCPQRTDDFPDRIEDLIEVTDEKAFNIKGILGIETDWSIQWNSLSHGERKRAQVGVILWRKPLVFALDELTNHLDAEACHILAGALESFRGAGLLVSHDRELLDSLCQQCLFVESPVPVMRPVGYSEGSEQARREQESIRRDYDLAKQNHRKLKREVTRRRMEADRSDRRCSKRGLPPKDHDARNKINRARLTGKDAVAGKLHRQMQSCL